MAVSFTILKLTNNNNMEKKSLLNVYIIVTELVSDRSSFRWSQLFIIADAWYQNINWFGLMEMFE